MKALVLCGGIPQIALLKELRKRGITTILADMNENVGGRKYADIFYPVSVLDVDAVRDVAKKEKVDFVITVCADQVLQVVAQVSEELGLPCYIDFETAINVSKKSFMKRIFSENGIPSSKHVIMDDLDKEEVSRLSFPLIVKPVDSYSSKGVCKVSTMEELETAFDVAKKISRTSSAIVEEFVEGQEITVDVYVEDGKAHVLCVSAIDKIPESDRFVIHRTRYPSGVSDSVLEQVEVIAQKISKAFKLFNTPMLIQMIIDDEKLSVVEFCARTGGGDKFRSIEKATGFNVINAVLDLTLGKKPHVVIKPTKKHILNEFLYCSPGTFDHLEGFDELVEKQVLTEYYQLKAKGTKIGEISSSSDRVAYFTLEAETLEDLKRMHILVNQEIKVVDDRGKDILYHDLVGNFIG